MKKTKVVMALACAVLLVGASVMGTLAYLTSTTDEVKNTFTVGENVAITLDEYDTDEYGNVVKATRDNDGKITETEAVTDKKGGTRGTGNKYKLMPGHSYVKDPTVHVTGENCYVFVEVKNGIANIEADTKIAAQMTNNGWVAVAGYDNLYVYAKSTGEETVNKTVAKKGDNLVVFSNFTVMDSIENNGFNAYKDAEITIKAYAVQTVDFESKTPAEIWGATFGKPATTVVDGE